MALDDWVNENSSDTEDDTQDYSEPETTPRTLLTAIDRYIVDAASKVDGAIEIDDETVTARRTTLAATVALAISHFDSDEIKDLEEFNMAEIQREDPNS